MPVIRVALSIPVDTLFDYQADDVSEQDIGARACVPFGKKKLTGVIAAVGTQTQIAAEKLKPAHCIFREIKPLPAALLDLFHFCSQYYHHPLGMVIMNGLPVKLRNNKAVSLKRNSHDDRYTLTAAGAGIDLSSIPARNRVARKLLNDFQRTAALTASQIKQISPRAIKLIPEWIQLGWITVEPISAAQVTGATKIPTLTSEQAIAVDAITANNQQFDTWLLHGITGSGKTEVYLRIIEPMLARNKQTLVLIPEISLTPQLEAVFRNRFPAIPLTSLHSGLNDTERLSGWLQAQNGAAKIILGTRLAVFTPLPSLGLIIVDEEQDSSFKQQDGLRYSARDLAIFRGKQVNIPVVLGSATPSLESYHHALTGRYRHVRLLSRAV